jgi:predicted membrane GTPase involved in stress response
MQPLQKIPPPRRWINKITGATDEQTDFDICYASAIKAQAGDSATDLKDNMFALFDKILNLPAPPVTESSAAEPTQLLIANIEYDEFKVWLKRAPCTSTPLY